MTAAVQAEGLVKRYGDTIALDGVDLRVRAGTVLGLLGPNGAGKTTLVKILATLVRPDAGRGFIDGHDVVRDAAYVRRQISLTGQYAALDENLTGTENLFLVARLLGSTRRAARARAADLLALFDLADAGGRAVRTYSGGMRRRLDLAVGLVGRPRVLFLDEPSTGLDPHARAALWDVVRDEVRDGVTVLLTTQYLDEADQLADEITVIDHGRVIAAGTPERLKERTGARTLELTPADAEQAGAIAVLVGPLAGGTPVIRDERVSVPVTDPDVLPAIVRRLDDAGLRVTELALRKPSLDEVFRTLTARAGTPEGALR